MVLSVVPDLVILKISLSRENSAKEDYYARQQEREQLAHVKDNIKRTQEKIREFRKQN